MGCGSSKGFKDRDTSNQLIDNISADLKVEKENLLKNGERLASDAVQEETNADKELRARVSHSEVDQEREDSFSKSLTPEGKLAKERYERSIFQIGRKVKLLKTIPHSIVEGSVGVVKHRAYNVIGVKFKGGTTVKFWTNDVDEWLEIYNDSDAKSFVDNVKGEIVQPVLYGSASIWAAVNAILDDRKSPKWVLTKKLRCFAIKLINLLEESGFNPEFEQIVALHEGLSEE